MPKKSMIKEEGQQMEIPNDKADELPITLSYTQAKALTKSLRPPPSDKQKEHMQKLIEMNKLKWEQKKKEKEEKMKDEEIKRMETSTRIVVKPKRVYKNNKKIFPKTDAELIDDDDYETYEDEIEVKPIKKKIIKRVTKDEDDDDDDDDIIQKTKKASKVVETINKLDKAISQMKSNNNRYDNILNKLKF